MAKIVLGLGTSHSPQLSYPAEKWADLGKADQTSPHLIDGKGNHLTYQQVLAKADPRIAREELTVEVFKAKFDRLQKGVKAIGDALKEHEVDILVVIGDDQEELIHHDNMPPLMIYWGETIPSQPRIFKENVFPTVRMAAWAYGTEETSYPVAKDLARHLIVDMMKQGFDVANGNHVKEGMGMGHAFAFMYGRIFDGRVIPIVPVLVNTYFPPNQPSPKRCYQYGQALRKAVESWKSDARVAVIGSGGLTHFIIDEAFDKKLLNAFKKKDKNTIFKLPLPMLDSGNSEARNWIVAAGASEHLNFDLIDYVPAYRSPAGTGGGWTFGRWVPGGKSNGARRAKPARRAPKSRRRTR